jgi:hypothetical protein
LLASFARRKRMEDELHSVTITFRCKTTRHCGWPLPRKAKMMIGLLSLIRIFREVVEQENLTFILVYLFQEYWSIIIWSSSWCHHRRHPNNNKRRKHTNKMNIDKENCDSRDLQLDY